MVTEYLATDPTVGTSRRKRYAAMAEASLAAVALFEADASDMEGVMAKMSEVQALGAPPEHVVAFLEQSLGPGESLDFA